MNVWNGAFTPPLRKHRDFCGDITNHIEVGAVTQLDADEEQELEDQFENAESDLIIVGSGGIAWLIEVRFIGGEDLYQYVVRADEEPSEYEAKQAVKDVLTHQ